MNWLEDSINKQRNYIEGFLTEPLSQLAKICGRHWCDRFALDLELKYFIEQKPDHRCRMLYVIDKKGIQRGSNISDDAISDSKVGQDLSSRPYLSCIDDEKCFSLSDVYMDRRSRKPCITAIHQIRVNNEVMGYIAADFDLKDLPLKNVDSTKLLKWRQIKGDPSIRGTLFQQTRTISAMDRHIDQVLDVVESLITEQGIFHAKLHFSSSRATLWPYSDPYHYRLHVLDEIITPKVCLAYEKMVYPTDANVSADKVSKILNGFKLLRDADENIYLRAASLNVMNGLVGLNFSCDGSHYMPADEFISKDMSFWIGDGEPGMACNT